MKFRETPHVELKASYVPDIKKEVAAFANTEGGTLYLGIGDDGKPSGLGDQDAVLRQMTDAVRDGIRPDVTPFVRYSFLEVDGNVIIEVAVTRGTKRPYYLSDKGLKPSGVYVRQGTSSVPSSEDAIRRMIKEADGDSFEANRSLEQDLTFIAAEKEMVARGMDFGPVQKRNLGLTTEDEVHTNLGLLLSDQCRHIIKLAVFQGTDKLVFKDRQEFTGSVFQQLEEAYRAINHYNATRATFRELLRTDERDYPVDAIRESLLNAIVHRDYGYSGSTIVNIFSDRMEFITLGGLVSGLSLAAIMVGASQTRNERLAALFYRMRLIEAYGTGIGKIVDSYSDCIKKPTFEPVEGAFRVTLPKREPAGSTGKRLVVYETSEPSRDIRQQADKQPVIVVRQQVDNQLSLNSGQQMDKRVPANSRQKMDRSQHPDSRQLMIRHFKETGEVSRAELEEVLGLGTTRIHQLLVGLINDGLVVKNGAGKLTRYRLKQNTQGHSSQSCT